MLVLFLLPVSNVAFLFWVSIFLCTCFYRFLQKYPEYPKPYERHEICLDEVAKELSKYKYSSRYYNALFFFFAKQYKRIDIFLGHTNHRNTGILPKYRNTREKYRYTYERRLLKTPILALINQFSNIVST